MDLTTLVMIGATAWLLLVVFVLALCRMAARGDAAQEQLARAWQRHQALGGSFTVSRRRALGDL